MSATFETLGPYLLGERPEPWTHQWLDANGDEIDITDWTVNVTWKINGGTQQERAGTIVSGPAGTARHTWQEGDLDDAGILAGEMTVSGDSVILARSFQAVILSPRGGTL